MYKSKLQRATDILLLSVISIFILTLGLLIFLRPPKATSDKERRPLAQMPRLSVSAFLDGRLSQDVSDFYSDQLPLRDLFTSAYALTELALGKCEVNGTVYADGALAIRSEHSNAAVERGIAVIEGLGAVLYIPPDAIDLLASPPPFFKAREASIPADSYYRTDHHWTSEGAYIAYTELCDRLGVTPYGEDFFTKETVCTDFYGTAYARSCLPEWAVRADEIILYRYEGDVNVRVTDPASGETRGLYSKETLSGADKYAVFLGGNFARLSVSDGKSKPRLLLIKDSFANSVVPFLALHFDIEMIDPRYCTAEYLTDLLTGTDFPTVLFVVSRDTLESHISRMGTD